MSKFREGSSTSVQALRKIRTSKEDPSLLSQISVKKTPGLFVKDTDSIVQEKRIMSI